jgi:hypothetical protein
MEASTSTGGTPADRSATIGQRLREDSRQRIEATRRSAAERVEGIAEAFDAARSRLDRTQPTLAAYTANLSENVERLARRLRDSSLEDLARDARQFAVRNPALFLLGSAAAGVVLARYLKLSFETDADSTRAWGGNEAQGRSPSPDEDPLLAE